MHWPKTGFTGKERQEEWACY